MRRITIVVDEYSIQIKYLGDAAELNDALSTCG